MIQNEHRPARKKPLDSACECGRLCRALGAGRISVRAQAGRLDCCVYMADWCGVLLEQVEIGCTRHGRGSAICRHGGCLIVAGKHE